MLPDLTMSNVESFWSRVDKSGDCWLWTGYTDPAGYGQLRLGGERYRAHRLAWELLNGPIPDGMYLCHNCPTGDNPSCVNPSHIFLGTHTQNMQDCTAKGMRAPESECAMKRPDIERLQKIEAAARALIVCEASYSTESYCDDEWNALVALLGMGAAELRRAILARIDVSQPTHAGHSRDKENEMST